jgi:hypothetical protein
MIADALELAGRGGETVELRRQDLSALAGRVEGPLLRPGD